MDNSDHAAVRQDLDGAVLILTLCNAPVNTLGIDIRLGLAAGLDRAEQDPAVSAVVIQGQGRGFSAGADIREFGQPPRRPSLPDLCRRIEDFGKPVVAALHGFALGGGLELGLAAGARVGQSGLRAGLPEVALGLLPGAGGTQRLPRLIGAKAALQMMMTGQPVSAEAALDLGLLELVVSKDDGLLQAAIRLARSDAILQKRRWTPDPADYITALAAARRSAAKSGSAAQGRIVDCVEAGLLLPLDQGLAFERTAFEDLRASPEATALRYIFLAERQADHPPAGHDAAAAKEITHLGVWGAGAAAVSLTNAALQAGLKVTVCDPSREALVSALEAVGLAQEAAVTSGLLTADARDADWARLIPAIDPKALSGAEVIILTEAERPLAVDFARGLGQDTTVLVAGGVPEGAGDDVMGIVLAPQSVAEVALTSGMSTGTIATGLAALRKLGLKPVKSGLRGRIGGIGGRVSGAGLQAVQALCHAGVPVAQVVRAVSGFIRLPSGLVEGQGALMAIQDGSIADRVLAAMANEGAKLLSLGAAFCPGDIDVIMVNGFGFPRSSGGPMHLADVRGLLVLRRNLRIWATEDDVWAPDPLFDHLIEDGRSLASLNQR